MLPQTLDTSRHRSICNLLMGLALALAPAP
jgi:hypothetical protein